MAFICIYGGLESLLLLLFRRLSQINYHFVCVRPLFSHLGSKCPSARNFERNFLKVFFSAMGGAQQQSLPPCWISVPALAGTVAATPVRGEKRVRVSIERCFHFVWSSKGTFFFLSLSLSLSFPALLPIVMHKSTLGFEERILLLLVAPSALNELSVCINSLPRIMYS